MLTIKKLCYDELPESEKKNVSNNGSGAEYAEYLLIYQDEKLIRIFSDAMEPEDAIFCRDLSWISDIIKLAYEIGRSEK